MEVGVRASALQVGPESFHHSLIWEHGRERKGIALNVNMRVRLARLKTSPKDQRVRRVLNNLLHLRRPRIKVAFVIEVKPAERWIDFSSQVAAAIAHQRANEGV